MKQIGAEIGVNESRVSQLHARAIRRLREALGEMNPQQAMELRSALIAFATKKPVMAKAEMVRLKPAAAAREGARVVQEKVAVPQGVVLPYKVAASRSVPARATLKMPRTRPSVAAAR
jgi:hypothetical protein